MSWQKTEQCWTQESRRKSEPVQSNREERRCQRRRRTQLAFNVWWRNGTTVKNASRAQGKSGSLWTRKLEACTSELTSLHEVRKKYLPDENASDL